MPTALITHADCLRHDMGAHHPEQPARLSAIADQLISSGIGEHLQSYEAPNRGQVKLLLEAPQGESMPDSQILLTEATLKTFATNGVLEQIAETPQCIFDYTRRTVSSGGPLFIHTADGKSWMQGQGFWLQLTNSHFIISNQVHIVIRNKSSAPVFR